MDRPSELDLSIFEQLVEESMVGMYLNDGSKFLYVNQAFARLFGYEREEIIGKLGPLDVTAPSYREVVSTSIKGRLKGDKIGERFVVELLRKDGSTFWGEVFGKVVSYDGSSLIIGSIVDVTIEKETERELRESKKTFESVVNTISDLVVLLDRDLRIRLANPAVFKAIKRSPEGALGRYCYEIFQRRDSICEDCPAIEAMETRHMAHRMRYNPNGTIFDRRVYPVFGDEGEIIGTLIVATDVTEKHRVQEALKESEALYRSLMNDVIDKSNVGVIILDHNFNIVWVNRAIERFFGFKREEWIGRSKRELIASHMQKVIKDPDLFAQKVLAAYENNTYIENFVCRVFPGDGREERWLEHWSQPIEHGPFAGGRIEHYHDITAQKVAEDRLKENEEFLRSLLTSIEDGISVLDKDLNIIYTNPVVNEWHRDEHPLVGKKCYKAYQKRELPCDDCPSLRCLETGRVETGEKTITHSSGERRWIELSAYPFKGSEGNVRGVVEFVRDITKQKRLEEQLHLSQRLEAIGRLAGGIAHDFNNILTVIMGSCELLQEEAETDPTIRDKVDLIKKASERAAALTKQLLVFSKRQTVEPKIVDLNQEISELKRMLVRVIGEDIEFVVDLADEPCLVKVDPSHMDQVIMNLVMNAREAMPKGGTLWISTSVKQIENEVEAESLGLEEGRYVVLSVRDSGVGMDEETQKKIFDPFFTTKERGTGLGLATVYGVVTQAGGTIKCYSRPGEGTTFEIYLPWKDGSMEDEEEVGIAQESSNIFHKGVLVVEDEETVRKLTVTLLRKAGYKVFEASNGQQALELLKDKWGEIDLVLTDLVMPQMGGKELYHHIKNRYPEMRVLFMSGYPSGISKEDGVIDDQEERFISKPFSKEELLSEVDRALKN